ncbi:LysR-family transcriptional regulator YdhB [Klebsiella pneumoniae]|uniref:LysR-family transcriptional regulator YdhB n=1 Tax=Klebsiella pneumoniae TaxID=573 RepID=A0A2X1QY68_KLEPN|nr:LysR-family transcriptional regulator YdhB [Klebsiella pneumoniae]
MWSEYSLEVVDAVARNGSFSAAAQELHRVPSAVSYTVRQLEEWLAVPLFERRHRDVEVDPRRGLVFYRKGALLSKKCRSPASSVSKLRTAGADSCRSQWMIL